jgi:hypothetical protein
MTISRDYGYELGEYEKNQVATSLSAVKELSRITGADISKIAALESEYNSALDRIKEIDAMVVPTDKMQDTLMVLAVEKNNHDNNARSLGIEIMDRCHTLQVDCYRDLDKRLADEYQEAGMLLDTEILRDLVSTCGKIARRHELGKKLVELSDLHKSIYSAYSGELQATGLIQPQPWTRSADLFGASSASFVETYLGKFSRMIAGGAPGAETNLLEWFSQGR